ncbi:MAG TPA: hypothetical protein VNZ57_07080, partial [Longimicrobiales bacterium]|nr:hypothetical protein [Longimicrobiales bacterium]
MHLVPSLTPAAQSIAGAYRTGIAANHGDTQVKGRATHSRWHTRLYGSSLAFAVGAGLVVSLAVFGPAFGTDMRYARDRVASMLQSGEAARQDAERLTTATLLTERAASVNGMLQDVEEFYLEEVA